MGSKGVRDTQILASVFAAGFVIMMIIKLFLPSSLCGVVGTVVGRVVLAVVLFVCGGVVFVEPIPGILGGLVGEIVSKQFISGFSCDARGLKANEQRLSHSLDAIL